MNTFHDRESDSAREQQQYSTVYVDVSEHRTWFAVLGGLLLLLGIVAIAAAFAATLATVLLFGILLLIGGAAQLVHAFSFRRWKGVFLHALGGLLYAAVGILILVDPVSGAIGLTFLLAIFFLAAGFLKVFLALQAQSGWFGLSGGLDLLLGLLVLLGWPQTGGWVIGLFVGIELMFAGLSLLLLALASRQRSEPGLT